MLLLSLSGRRFAIGVQGLQLFCSMGLLALGFRGSLAIFLDTFVTSVMVVLLTRFGDPSHKLSHNVRA